MDKIVIDGNGLTQIEREIGKDVVTFRCDSRERLLCCHDGCVGGLSVELYIIENGAHLLGRKVWLVDADGTCLAGGCSLCSDCDALMMDESTEKLRSEGFTFVNSGNAKAMCVCVMDTRTRQMDTFLSGIGTGEYAVAYIAIGTEDSIGAICAVKVRKNTARMSAVLPDECLPDYPTQAWLKTFAEQINNTKLESDAVLRACADHETMCQSCVDTCTSDAVACEKYKLSARSSYEEVLELKQRTAEDVVKSDAAVDNVNSKLQICKRILTDVSAAERGALDALSDAQASEINASKSANYASDSEASAQASEANASKSAASASASATQASKSENNAKEYANAAKNAATEAAQKTEENIKQTLATTYKFKGSVNSVEALSQDAEVGDVYNVLTDGMNYAWTGYDWDALGGIQDLSAYAKSADVKTSLDTKSDLLHEHNITDIKDGTGNVTVSANSSTSESSTCLSRWSHIVAWVKNWVNNTALKYAVKYKSPSNTDKIDSNNGNVILAGDGQDNSQTGGFMVVSSNSFSASTSQWYTKYQRSQIKVKRDSSHELDTFSFEDGEDKIVRNKDISDVATKSELATATQGYLPATDYKVSKEVYFNGGIRTDSFKTLYGTPMVSTIGNYGFAFTGIYSLTNYRQTTPFYVWDNYAEKSTFKATEIFEDTVSLKNRYVRKEVFESELQSVKDEYEAKINAIKESQYTLDLREITCNDSLYISFDSSDCATYKKIVANKIMSISTSGLRGSLIEEIRADTIEMIGPYAFQHCKKLRVLSDVSECITTCFRGKSLFDECEEPIEVFCIRVEKSEVEWMKDSIGLPDGSTIHCSDGDIIIGADTND